MPGPVFKVAVTSGDRVHGALWASSRRAAGPPGAGDTRILAAAADQLAGAIERDRLRMDATAAEVARRSDVLKSALLDSVSHDLRTPLAAIRAAAGSLMDQDVELPPESRRDIAASIDREAEWLNRLVTNLLDMSRIEAGELRPSLAVFAVPELIAEALLRTGVPADGRTLTVDIPPDLPPVLVDEVFVSQVFVNTIDNARKYAGPDAPIRVSAAARRRRPGARLDRGWRPRRPGGLAAAPLREVLPGAAQGRRLAPGDRDRPRGGPGPRRGDERAGDRSHGATSAASPSTSSCRSHRPNADDSPPP